MHRSGSRQSSISLRPQCVLVPRIQNHSRNRRGGGRTGRQPAHHRAVARKLLVTIAADADRRPPIADEIEFHQIVLVGQRCERLINRAPQDSKRKFAVNEHPDPPDWEPFAVR